MSFLDLKHLSSKEFRYGKPPTSQNKYLQDFIKPHIESFNYVVDEGLKKAVSLIEPQVFELEGGKRFEISFVDAEIASPVIDDNDFHSKTLKVYPAECRERHSTYKGKLKVTLQWKIDGQFQGHITKDIAQIPIMVKSKVCSLANLSPKELIKRHEEAEEWGGYFIINGNEKIIRMLIMPRRNYPLAMIRGSWKTKGPLFTEYGVSIRTVQFDQTGNTNVLHYLNDGSCTLSFIYMKEQFFIPLSLVLKALTTNSDHYIYTQLINGEEGNLFLKDAIAEMLRSVQNENLFTQKSVLAYIGERFRVKTDLPEWKTDEEVAMYLIQNCILMHLTKNKDKFNMLVFMTQKLFALAHGKCAQESPDNPMHQEVLLGGHVYLIMLKDKLDSWLVSLRHYLKRSKLKTTQVNILNAISRTRNIIGSGMEGFLATGNIMSKSGLGLMQTSGFAVVADKLNFMRYLSHFRCIHRGAFFSQMRTTSVRKLLPEACGFLCPVHTPDGAPCGLLNHLAALCKVENHVYNTDNLVSLFITLGMIPLENVGAVQTTEYQYNVSFNGKIVGKLSESLAVNFSKKLRFLKVTGAKSIPQTMEVCVIPKTKFASQYPGVFIFTDVARMIRPVKNLTSNKIEYIGSFEQVYMDIAVCPEEICEGVTTHLEVNEISMLSALATLTPYSNYNQSPRNVYQCQMGKQTMGVPCQALKHRSDNKMYKIQTAQAPIVRNETYSQYGIDNFPLGINAVVAVISNTGYDMEDAMIINKGSLERGFAHGQIYKTEVVNLAESNRGGEICYFRFGADIENVAYKNGLIDKDGLPNIGRLIKQNEVYYSYYHVISGEYKQVKFKNMEAAYIDDIKLISNDKGDRQMSKVSIKLRIQRNPIIGDKFASRHGQKGILSQKWPMVDMPFTESGIMPDIIFNPHGFPSRMTIGMVIESMAGKSAALHGLVHNSTPFIFSEKQPAADYMGEMLQKGGYNYYGNETMYSGTNGEEMEVQIFIGIVYYQRLRHMVADKFQVRTTGPIDNLTHQPVQGRKRQGGIRFGEMERDALIAHGSGFLLHDRLFNCSDKFESYVCSLCGSLLSPVFRKPSSDLAVLSTTEGPKWICQLCDTGKGVTKILVPYVFKYLVAELAAMNIKVGLSIR